MNIEKQVAHWLKLAQEDWEVADELLRAERIKHGLFFVHLTIEKTLKALYTKRLAQVPPKTHDLAKLAYKIGLAVTEEQLDTLARINVYNLEGRYGDEDTPEVSAQAADDLRRKGEGIYQWLTKQF